MREKRNGAVAAAATAGVRPPALSARSPSPGTKKLSEACVSTAPPLVESLADQRDATLPELAELREGLLREARVALGYESGVGVEEDSLADWSARDEDFLAYAVSRL
jgi:hypothetical protein